jgi:hypothetical protein
MEVILQNSKKKVDQRPTPYVRVYACELAATDRMLR